MIWTGYDKDSYIEIESNPPYILGRTDWIYYVSRDNGKTFKNESMQVLYATYFFLS
jgi:hypothetical protein